MPSTENNNFEREPIQTRTRSASNQQERRNSVSDIAEYFQSKIPNQSTPMSTRKMSGKTTKEKEKERKRELKETRENIKNFIQNMPRENANGESQSTVQQEAITSESNQDHDNISFKDLPSQVNTDLQEVATNASNNNDNAISTKVSIATQTSEDEILSAIQELASKYQTLEDILNEPRLGIVDQLAKSQGQITELYTDINGAVSGLKVQMEKATKTANENTAKITQMEDSQRKIAALFDENKRLVNELKTMQGLLQKVSQQNSATSHQVLDLTRQGMEQNLLLHGVDDSIEVEDPKLETPMFTQKERCKHSAIKFFKEVLKVDIEVDDVWKAHRTGPYKMNKVRPLIVKLSYSAKDLVMENLSSLKGLSNQKTKQVYFISEQIPDGVAEIKKQTSIRAKNLREVNEQKPIDQRNKIQVINDKILINGELDEPEVLPPQPSQLLFLGKDKQKHVDALQTKLIETEPQKIKNSEFTALAAKVHSITEIKDLYTAVAQRHPSADHIMLGYALKENGKLKSGACDDRDYGLGAKIKKTIFESKARNTAVFVV